MRYLTGTVECASCHEVYDGSWADDSMDVNDMAEAPVASQTCPSCGHVQQEEWPGWTWQSEAG